MLSFIKYSFKLVLFVFLSIQNILYAAELTGTVSDTTSSPIKDVNVKLECLSGGSFLDSIYTDSIGKYSFTGYPIGSYKIYLSKSGYIDKDSLLVLGSDNVVSNFILHFVPAGTYHSGEENGIWLPSGNPHIIAGEVLITDNLYIAPGCSVVFDKSYYRIVNNGILKIGSKDSARVQLISEGYETDNIYSNDTTSSLVIENANIIAGMYLNCKEIRIDSIFYKCKKPECSISIQAKDTLYLTNSELRGDSSGTATTEFSLSANYILLTNSFFYKGVFTPRGNIRTLIEYCIFSHLEIKGRIQNSFLKLNHCNISWLRNTITSTQDPIEQPDSIVNCIILKFYTGGKKDTIYEVPFYCNLIEEIGWWGTLYFGLINNIQTNSNGDSCDLWFNINFDPLFADTTMTVLFNTSPAIKAASDGTNIGYYQGDGIPVGIIDWNTNKPKSSKIPFIYYNCKNANNLEVVFSKNLNPPFNLIIYDIIGRSIYKNENIRSNKLSINHSNWSNGIYFLKVIIGEKFYTRSIILQK